MVPKPDESNPLEDMTYSVLNKTPHHEDVWGSSVINPRNLKLDTRCEWSAASSGRFTPGERALDAHQIRGWMGPRIGLDAVTKRQKTLNCFCR